jgi:hypothetical protein
MKVPDLFVGKRLFVGCGEPVGLGIGPTEIRGSAYIEGPMIVGNPLAYPVAEANLMVARCVNVEALPPPPSIFKVSSRTLPPTPIDVMLGDVLGPVGVSVNSTQINIINASFININSPSTNGIGILNWVGAKTLTGVVAETGAEARAGKEAVSAATVDNGLKTINGPLLVIGTITTPKIIAEFGAFSSVAAPFKQFDIPHPTKLNHRLVHTCLEGPEIGVYYRGKLIDSTIIELPEYWRGLVDPESITVNLTPHGCYQELFVKTIEWGTRVIIQNNSGGAINCSYVVYGKRKDVPDLEVEYEGTEMRGKQNGTN